ncbi:MAG: hypothetical protein PS018_19825 [bacterium]|nr:hypothetical protein [bacterium]
MLDGPPQLMAVQSVPADVRDFLLKHINLIPATVIIHGRAAASSAARLANPESDR